MSKDILMGYVDSDVLVVEVNILQNNQEDLAYMQQIVMLEEGTTLDQLVPAEYYEAFGEVVSPYGITEEVYSRFKLGMPLCWHPICRWRIRIFPEVWESTSIS